MAAGNTKFGTLKSTHPRLDLKYVAILRALYKGGKALLQNDDVMRVVFPKYTYENEASYLERKSRAFYDNDFALVVNQISAGLAQDPIVFDDGSTKPNVAPKPRPSPLEAVTSPPPKPPSLPPFWSDLMKDATPPDDDCEAKTYDQIVREVVTEGLVCGWGWMLCDLPQPKMIPVSLAEQEASGALTAYPVPYTASQVTNWEEQRGQILWLRTYGCDQPALTPEADRTMFVHTWRVWDPADITTYVLVLDRNNKDADGKTWKDEDVVPVADVTPHTFGRVPWVRFDCSADNEPQFHVGDLIESRCRSLFNEANGETYGRLRYCFQQLYEFMGPDTAGPDHPISDAQGDIGRASTKLTRRAPDTVQVRGAEDKAMFVAPDMGGAAICRQALSEGREAIPRVTGQLALSSDTSGAMISRSGESKAQDKIAEEVVLGAIGKKALSFGRSVAIMLAIGRKESPDSVPPLKGYQHFSTTDADDIIEQLVALATAPIESAAFQVEHKLMAAIAILGDAATPELKALIRDQLETINTPESMAQSNMPPVPPGHQLGPDGKPVPIPPPPPAPPLKPAPLGGGK